MSSTSTVVDGRESTKATTRKSQRKRAKADYTDTAGRVQRQRKSTIRKSKTGRLSQLMSIPMDVLMEIFGHLHPLDLLHLARTTKAFRRVLMHRSSLFVWKAALSTVPGLPDCPPELSEPQWANLVFDAHCSLCSRPNIRTIDWVLRVRLCTECTKQHITDDIYEFSLDDYYDLTSAVPHRYRKRGHGKFLRDEYQKVYTQYFAIENLDARRVFFNERQQMVQRIKEHARLCMAWVSAQATARYDERERLKSSRYKAIVEKLVALGWQEEINESSFMYSLEDHKLVSVPQLLTDRIWANISGPIIQYMEEMKADRLARELVQLRAQRQSDSIKLLRRYKTEHAPFTDVMPEPLDFYDFGPIKEIVDQPRDVKVDSESFMHLMPELDGVVDEWRRVILAKFIRKVKVGTTNRSIVSDDSSPDLDNISDELRRIQLARTVFSCIPCNSVQSYDDFGYYPFDDDMSSSHPTGPLWFPRVLGHSCLTKQQGDMSVNRWQWSCDSIIKVDQEAGKAAVAVIEACGMDPSIATVDGMDQLDARLRCLVCRGDDLANVVFDWRSAVKHQRDYHPSDLGDWRMLTANEAEVALVEKSMGEITKPEPVLRSPRRVWLCFHCLDSDYDPLWKTLEEVEEHLRLCHNVEDARVNHDYVKDFAALELYE